MRPLRYLVELTPAAYRALAGLPRSVLKRVDARIRALAENPHPRGVKKLRGPEGLLRLRVGDHRILYLVEAERRAIRHRREAYRA